MKFLLTFKTTNALDIIKADLSNTSCKNHARHDWDCEDCLVERHNGRRLLEAARKLANKFVEYDEYVRIEFDTDTGTATVIPVK